MNNKILQGDSLEMLKTLPDESVDCVVTSPPYWALRDYGTATWEGGDINCDHKGKPLAHQTSIHERTQPQCNNQPDTRTFEIYKDICKKCGAKRIDRQLGLEPTFQEYIEKLCNIFDEVKRVLKKEGTCWVNLGDTYAGSMPKQPGDFGHNSKVAKNLNEAYAWQGTKNQSVQDKSLCQIPSRFAIEMSNRGWILRNEIIWHKPNCMPSSVKDRFTVDFEKVFFFVKSKKYWFETQYEEAIWDLDGNGTIKRKERAAEHLKSFPTNERNGIRPSVRIDNPNGKYKDGQQSAKFVNGMRNKRAVWKVTTRPFKEAHFATFPEALIEPMIKAGCPKEGLVLDPFMGACTTAVVARKLGRNYLGIELNPEYIKICDARLLTIQSPLL